MITWEILFAVFSSLILFFYGIENFSREILAVARGTFATILSKVTEQPLLGALLGAAITALIQSSAATTNLTANLINTDALVHTESRVIIGQSRRTVPPSSSPSR